MGIRELKCPHCGASVSPTEGYRILICSNCGSNLEYDDGIVRTYHETRYFNEAEMLRQQVELEKLKDRKRQDKHELKKLAIRLAGPLIIILLIVVFFCMRVRSGAQYDYRGLHYTSAKSQLQSAGFWNVTCIPVRDLDATESKKDEEVIEVHIRGTDNLYKTFYRWDKVEIYYHKMDENPPVTPPFDSGSNFSGWKLQDVVDKLYGVGFATVYSRVENDLDSVSDGNRGKVFNVTINGETDWTRNRTRKTYHRNDKVIIYYHDAKEDAQAAPPVGNSTYYHGMDYNLVKAEFEKAGFTNIQIIATSNVSSVGDVTEVTVNGETEWSYGIAGMLRKSYKRNVLVKIIYNSTQQ